MIKAKFSNEDWNKSLIRIYHNAQLERYFLQVNNEYEDFDTFKAAATRLQELMPGIVAQLF